MSDRSCPLRKVRWQNIDNLRSAKRCPAMTPGDHEPNSATPASGASDNQTPAKQPKRHRPKGFRRDPFRDNANRRGLQLTKTPDYLLIGHICADLQPDGSVVLGGTALYSALTAARLGARVAVLTRGVYGREVVGMQVPNLDILTDEGIQVVAQDAEVPTTFINVYQADQEGADVAVLGWGDRPAGAAAALAEREGGAPGADCR